MTGQTPTTEPVESNRARVRRLLIEPLTEHGFGFSKKTDADTARTRLDAIADSLGYMSDAGLSALRECLRDKGQGSARTWWPTMATVEGFAQAFEPRPLIERPELLRWFASRAGAEALAAGRHVAEYQFWEAKGYPPVNKPEDARRVAERAAGHARRLELIEDRLRRGVPLIFDEAEWLGWYRGQDRYIRDLIGEAVSA